jgi:hypothetical protein
MATHKSYSKATPGQIAQLKTWGKISGENIIYIIAGSTRLSAWGLPSGNLLQFAIENGPLMDDLPLFIYLCSDFP